MRLLPHTAVLAAPLVLALAACNATGSGTPGTDAQQARTVTVSSTEDACRLSADTAPSGRLSFEVTNDGSQVTEFYLYAEDGTTVVGEVENVGPQLSRELVIRAEPGSYVAACKPGMTGEGIRSEFTVTDSGEPASLSRTDRRLVDAANATRGSDGRPLIGLESHAPPGVPRGGYVGEQLFGLTPPRPAQG